MDIKQQREEEIRSSLFTGAKAFAVGAMLILVLSVTGGPQPPHDATAMFAGTTATDAAPATVQPAGDPTAPASEQKLDQADLNALAPLY